MNGNFGRGGRGWEGGEREIGAGKKINSSVATD